MKLAESHRAILRHVVDGAPALVFLAVLLITRDFRLATWFVVAGAVLAVGAGYALERRLRPLPSVTAAMALVFGGASLAFHNKDILKIKMTIVDGILGAVLFVGLLIGKNPLKALLGGAFDLPEKAWARLAIRYGAFWWACAISNEIVWRTQSDIVWGYFRTGALIAAVVFALAQAPFLIANNRRAEPPSLAEPPESGA